eukprot:gnl/Chilomastix_cuspidata/8777.p2 GENE.gnl/Chilomastix_cuspidata/8777~~gnl/Chilomastix_cuspidata/8777.p2  ORF type:complete len:102 (-),score=25.55 gnl/Chilomastix_cuspidata/8777:34-339(-)
MGSVAKRGRSTAASSGRVLLSLLHVLGNISTSSSVGASAKPPPRWRNVRWFAVSTRTWYNPSSVTVCAGAGGVLSTNDASVLDESVSVATNEPTRDATEGK